MPAHDRYGDPTERYTYKSPLIERLRAADGRLVFGRVTICAAPSFGFCWGVDRAVAMVQDALAAYPEQPLWLLDQIIHNPRVNADFKARGVRFLRGPFAEAGAAPALGPDDVVVIPAFSATVEDMHLLEAAGCTVVDTTCPWVIKPHKRTLHYMRDGFTTVIHGLVRHEETRASCSLIASRGGHYVVVADRDQAEHVGAVIRGELPPAELAGRLPVGACSPGFDATQHLDRIGTINQTTMLASETRQIERQLREAVVQRHGADGVGGHFRELNTICGATQANQDAVAALVAEGGLDLLVVVGGYDSSNTRNLTRVAEGYFPSFHVDGPDAIGADTVRHRCPETGDYLMSSGWLPAGPVTVGFTAGASTPDVLLGDAIKRVLCVAGEPVDAVLAP